MKNSYVHTTLPLKTADICWYIFFHAGSLYCEPRGFLLLAQGLSQAFLQDFSKVEWTLNGHPISPGAAMSLAQLLLAEPTPSAARDKTTPSWIHEPSVAIGGRAQQVFFFFLWVFSGQKDWKKTVKRLIYIPAAMLLSTLFKDCQDEFMNSHPLPNFGLWQAAAPSNGKFQVCIALNLGWLRRVAWHRLDVL